MKKEAYLVKKKWTTMFNFWDWKTKATLEGVFTGQLKNVGKFRTNVFVFNINEEVVHSWAYTDLINALYGVPFKTKVKITYNGKEKMPESENMFMSFSLEVIESPKLRKLKIEKREKKTKK